MEEVLASLLGALSQGKGNPNLQDVQDIPRPAGSDLANLAKGVPSGIAGLPVDLMTSAMRPFGYDTPPKEVVGSSDWFGEGIGADTESLPFLAGQMVSPDSMDAVKLAGLAVGGKRLSRLESEAQGYWHEIGDKKRLKKPFQELSRETKDLPTLDSRVISPESLQNSVIIPALGDRSDAAKLLTKVGADELPNPVHLQGGHGFMRENPESIWASAKGPVSHLNRKVKAAQDMGFESNLMFMPMTHGATNFNTMITDVMLEQINGRGISKTAKNMFDREMRKKRSTWKGLNSPDAHSDLQNSGALRTEFVRVANLEDFQRRGFPDITEARFAVTDPSLMNYSGTEWSKGGQSIGRLSGKNVENPQVPHKTYESQMGGEYLGGFEEPLPRELLFPDFTAARRAKGTRPADDPRAFELSKPVQFADQEWVDNIMNALQGR